MSKYSISIIVLSHNNETIYESIEALINQIDTTDEIIIVDDHSSCEYQESLQRYCNMNNITLLFSKKTANRSHNRNLGATASHNPILLFIDSDMLLFSTSIPSIKRAYAYNDSIAFIGTRSAGRYDPTRMSIFDGCDISKILMNNENIEFLSELPTIKDTRLKAEIYTDNLPEQKYYWMYYYTCCCTITREIFFKVGGFDENYTGWGVEDIDLGYRISQEGKISFLRGFGGVHVPHQRDILYSEQDNCKNLKYLLQKFQRYDVEFVSVYRIPAKLLEKVKLFYNCMRLIDSSIMGNPLQVDTLYINNVSINAPNGLIVYYDKSGKKSTYNILGVSTFFQEKSIENIVISANIVLYPKSIICGILQECLRIGRNVFLDGTFPSYRLDWDDFPNLTLLQPQRRNEYRIHDVMEFYFEKVPNENKYMITSKYLDLEVNKDTQKLMPAHDFKFDSIRDKTFVIINLSRGSGYKLLLQQLQKIANINFVGEYTASNIEMPFEPIIQFPEHLYSLLLLRTPILLVVEKIQDFNFDLAKWGERNHNNDLIIDLTGKIIQI